MDTYIQHQAVFKERRKEMLHKKWVENVVRPLQQRIIEKVISYRKPGQSQVKYEYCLKHTNKPVGTGFYCFFYTTMMPFFLLSSCRFLLWPAVSGSSHHSHVCLLVLTASVCWRPQRQVWGVHQGREGGWCRDSLDHSFYQKTEPSAFPRPTFQLSVLPGLGQMASPSSEQGREREFQSL